MSLKYSIMYLCKPALSGKSFDNESLLDCIFYSKWKCVYYIFGVIYLGLFHNKLINTLEKNINSKQTW